VITEEQVFKISCLLKGFLPSPPDSLSYEIQVVPGSAGRGEGGRFQLNLCPIAGFPNYPPCSGSLGYSLSDERDNPERGRFKDEGELGEIALFPIPCLHVFFLYSSQNDGGGRFPQENYV